MRMSNKTEKEGTNTDNKLEDNKSKEDLNISDIKNNNQAEKSL